MAVILGVGIMTAIVFESQFDVVQVHKLAFVLALPVAFFAVAKGFRYGAVAAIIAGAVYGSKLLYDQIFVGSGIGEGRLQTELFNLASIVGTGFIVGLITEFLYHRQLEPFKEEATIVETFVPDEETGLYNFKSFRWMLRGEMKRVKRYNSPMSMAFLKIKNLDEFQKRYDYQKEVMLFREIGHFLRSMLREADYVGKYSDNEIGLVLPETGLAGCNVVCNRMREKFGEMHDRLNKMWDEATLDFEFSQANYPKDASNLEELIDVLDTRYEPIK
jgi:diguanylate cyclase (GGDEF)-like protein